ncbi:phospholipase D-like domain-containing protein [Erythrobacter sp.]|uniref:phospholipase D-like domain-containing protein n=1 Tax=Erythrobacter sp. TaxID=1042 RepID=UPI001425D219|nr:phospholipase D-like domain-containing protein [Erythrobacter sp.]QIQ86559.1 MAG: phospholipase [Erythrobacter sp.]
MRDAANLEPAGEGRKPPEVASVTGQGRVLVEGETCWRKARAERVAFIVDAAGYFAAAKEAILKAERCVYLIGWEFDLDIRLQPDLDDPRIPDRLRQFLEYAVEERPDLEIFILQWGGAMLFNIARQLGSWLSLKASANSRVHFRLDNEHPTGACHHQKIVVIDDRLAFCGGIDMTSGRWDTPDHSGYDCRRADDGDDPLPWHDMTLAVDGEAARALGDLARRRWKIATGNDLPVPAADTDIWPDSLGVDLEDAVAGIALSKPGHAGEGRVDQIEKLWCRAIASAKERIYIENQFLSSGRIGDALRARLEEEDGPEIAIVLPESAETWLESEAMDTRRALIVEDLRRADHGGKLGIYHPVNREGRPIYVHAKLLVVDEELVRVGSSNMASRSFVCDTECDLAFEAADQPALREFAGGLRTRLLAEHLAVGEEEFAAEVEQRGGRIVPAIEALRREEGHSLRVLTTRRLDESEIALARSKLFDPEDPVGPAAHFADFAGRLVKRKRFSVTAGVLALGALAYALRRR